MEILRSLYTKGHELRKCKKRRENSKSDEKHIEIWILLSLKISSSNFYFSNAEPVLHFHCLCKQSGHSLQAPVAGEACLVGLPEGLVGPGDHEDSLHQAFGGDHPNDAVLPPFFSSTCPLHNVWNINDTVSHLEKYTPRIYISNNIESNKTPPVSLANTFLSPSVSDYICLHQLVNESESQWKDEETKDKSKTKFHSLKTELKKQAPETSQFIPTSPSLQKKL